MSSSTLQEPRAEAVHLDAEALQAGLAHMPSTPLGGICSPALALADTTGFKPEEKARR